MINRPPRIIVTRPEPDAAGFAAIARAAGLEPVLCPVMTIAFTEKPSLLEGAGALAFTSANGVRAFCAGARDRSLPVFAVGAITGDAAKQAGFGQVVAADGDVDSLADVIASSPPVVGEVIHIAGAERAGDLVAALGRRGVAARRAVLYEARPASSLTDEGKAALASSPPAAAAAFFSPRSAALFIGLVREAGLEHRLREVRAACLSEAVADAARAADWRSVIVAGRRSGESLIASLMSALEAKRG